MKLSFGYVILLHSLYRTWASKYYDDRNQRVCLDKGEGNECFPYGLADFGSIAQYTTKGLIVPALPANACSTIENRNKHEKMDYIYFVLIKEGGCSFGYKALMANNAGYEFAIIHSTTSDTVVRMAAGKYGKKVDEIMSIFVGKTAGNLFLKYNYTTGTLVTIHPPSFFPNLEFYLIPFVIIIGICFILMAMFMVSRYYRSYLEKRRNRITPANLKKIPTKRFKKGDEYYDVCAICLDEYKDGDKLRILPCDHVYHCKCVDPWLTEGKKTCPVCKRPVESKKSRNTSQTDVERGQGSGSDIDADETTPLIQPSAPSNHLVEV
ncbi:E3 ubiquitin-protein ligase RNF13-like [Actinia tenebrosa]|uniref:E3 ubiquitin-protein ligase RNF13-like n=1 Tax=Actinia tenebrosa TaxID=6105 RepID=A0A6P8IEZ2_ACTTE|nr:E3 ubiquitin-protein ligase RNF13-like [Actinia tenebrosa]